MGSFKVAYIDVETWTMQPIRYLGTKLKHFEGPKELSGPLGIAQMVTKATREGISYVILSDRHHFHRLGAFQSVSDSDSGWRTHSSVHHRRPPASSIEPENDAGGSRHWAFARADHFLVRFLSRRSALALGFLEINEAL